MQEFGRAQRLPLGADGDLNVSFIPQDELGGLRIVQAVFHIVGPGPEHFQLLQAFSPGKHERFFLDRIRSIKAANRYSFLPDAGVRAQLARVEADAKRFQEESENLATVFDAAHRGSAATGAFLVFVLDGPAGRLYALLKFEDERVLSYDVVAGKGTRPTPTFAEIARTFVQNRNAMQKAAFIRLRDGNDEVFVVDRQNPQRPAAYFEQFLGVRRLRSEREMTQKMVEIAARVARRHKDKLPPDALSTVAKRLYDASQSGAKVDGEKVSDFFTSIVGPLPEDSPVLADLAAELRREGMFGESFVLEKHAVPKPRNRRVETLSGVKITFPVGLQGSVVTVDRSRGEITIRDTITVDDVELDKPDRPRT